jgi:hypothetical protein
MTADCGLCPATGVKLIDSHFMPKALYKLARDDRHKNANPVLIGGGKAALSSKQASDYFLCRGCEDLFSNNGESWVLNNCWRDDKTFRLRDRLVATSSLPGSEPDTQIFLMDSVPGIDADKIIYFAASVFWRGAARSWTVGDREYPQLAFGDYEMEFRKFLLGKGAFPAGASMLIFVGSSMTEIENNISAFPKLIVAKDGLIFKLRIPGITFYLGLGSVELMKSSSVHVKGRPIYMTKENDQFNFKSFAEEYAQSQRVGPLKVRTDGSAAAPPRWSADEIRQLLPSPRKR